MLKICHITSAHNTDDIRIFEKECVSLAKVQDYEVFLVGQGESKTLKNVNIVGVGEKPDSRLKRIFGFSSRVVKKAIELDADIYHLHDPELLLFTHIFKKKGKKVIFDSHEDYVRQIKTKEYLPTPLNIILAKIYRIIENHACKYIDGAIFPCPINGVHPFMGRVKNIVFIDNLPIINDNLCNLKMREKPVVCTAGSLTKERGIEVLVDACYSANVELILAGNFYPDSFEEELRAKESFRCVDYRGYCNREQIEELYSISSIGVSNIFPVGQYLNLTNLPTKVYEFMMAGMPFIISNFKYFEKFIDKYKCGICVDPMSVEEICNAIKLLSDDKQLAQNMINNGRKLILEEFNWANEEKKLYEFYKIV